MSALITVRFGGDLAPDNRISLRTLGKAAAHLQSAVDRAALNQTRAIYAKHTRISSSEYERADLFFEVGEPASFKFFGIPSREDQTSFIGYLLKVLREAEQKSKEAAADGIDNEVHRIKLRDQAEARLTHLNVSKRAAISFEKMAAQPETQRPFVDKAIMGQVNEVLSPLRSEASGDSFIEIILEADGEKYSVKFTPESARTIYWYTSQKILGSPVLYKGMITDLHRKLNSNYRKAAFFNLESKKKSNLLFATRKTFDTVISEIGEDNPMNFLGCPIIEYGALDPLAGDVFFLKTVE